MALVIVTIAAILYEPLSLRHVVAQIESAKTPAEERAAFRLARRYRPFEKLVLPTSDQNVVLSEGPGFTIVFRQVSPFTGEHYSARRTLLAYSNVLYLESSVIRPVSY